MVHADLACFYVKKGGNKSTIQQTEGSLPTCLSLSLTLLLDLLPYFLPSLYTMFTVSPVYTIYLWSRLFRSTPTLRVYIYIIHISIERDFRIYRATETLDSRR